MLSDLSVMLLCSINKLTLFCFWSLEFGGGFMFCSLGTSWSANLNEILCLSLKIVSNCQIIYRSFPKIPDLYLAMEAPLDLQIWEEEGLNNYVSMKEKYHIGDFYEHKNGVAKK